MILFLPFFAIASALPFILKKIQADRRYELLCNQLHQAIENMVHALHVGLGLPQAIEVAAKEGEHPLSDEWEMLLTEVHLGVSWADALDHLAKRVDLAEMRWFVTAVQITRQTGGSLTHVLEILASTLQERLVLREKIKALTAQGKASGIVLAALPFLLLGALTVLVPALMRPMFSTTLGQTLLTVMMISVAIGGLVMWKMVQIKAEL